MLVLILALGGNRMRAAVEESAQVVATGGRAVVLVDNAKSWRRFSFDPAVRVVDLAELEASRLSMKLEQMVLFKVPRRLFRTVGRGPLRKPARRASGVYESRFADRVHRRVVLPLYRPGWGAGSCRVIRRHVLDNTPPDLIVVTDPASMPYAAGLLASYGPSANVPQLSFGLDYAVLAEPAN